ncbi:MAG TPA: hypothetical protein VEG44_06220 [Candidatus Acidoferrales bacterium]|nr:hypothetical protein [Candidatus Acidoferrales bacterium]
MVKKRIIIAVRRGAFDPSTAMYEIPICFENEEVADRARQNLENELTGVANIKLAVVNQTMIGIRYDPHKRYDEVGDFPRLYPTRKDTFHGYVLYLDFPDDLKVKEVIQRGIEKLKLAIIKEGTTESQILEFIE